METEQPPAREKTLTGVGRCGIVLHVRSRESGGASFEEGCVGSVLKWRRKKMNRHKYRLLRKKMRHRKRR